MPTPPEETPEQTPAAAVVVNVETPSPQPPASPAPTSPELPAELLALPEQVQTLTQAILDLPEQCREACLQAMTEAEEAEPEPMPILILTEPTSEETPEPAEQTPPPTSGEVVNDIPQPAPEPEPQTDEAEPEAPKEAEPEPASKGSLASLAKRLLGLA